MNNFPHLGLAEDYSKAKVLDQIEHLGETFIIVRQRFNGKPWRKYTALLTASDRLPVVTTTSFNATITAELAKEKFARAFQDRDAMLAQIDTIRAAAKEIRAKQ